MHILEDALRYLVTKRSFYAHLLANCVIKIDRTVPTAGVNVKRGKVHLYINPLFWNELGIKDGPAGQAAVLEHEMMHVAHGHLFRHKLLDTKTNVDGITIGHTGINVSMDCSINQYIPRLPKEFKCFDKEGKPLLNKDGTEAKGNPVTFESFKKSLEEKGIDVKTLEKQREFEHYFKFLKDNADKLPKGGGESGEGMGDTIDDHSKMGESDCSPEDVKEACGNAMKKAYNSAKQAGVGSLVDIEKIMNDIYKNEINWKAILNRFMGSSSKILQELTRKRPDRRFGIKFQGKRTLPKLKIDIYIDTSGSVGKAEKEAFFNQINHIIDDRYEVYLICGDSEITTKPQLYDRKGVSVDFKGGGGTNYLPFFEMATKRKVDAMIVLGDGYCFDSSSLEKPKFPIMWAITEGGVFPKEWGTKLTISLPK